MRRVFILDIFNYDVINSEEIISVINNLVELDDSTGITIGTISSRDDKFSIVQNITVDKGDIDFLLEYRRRFWVITTFDLVDGEIPDINSYNLQPRVIQTDNGPRPAMLFFNVMTKSLQSVINSLEDSFLNFEFDGLTNNELKEEFLKIIGTNHCIFIHDNQFYIPVHVKSKTDTINTIDVFEYFLI